MNQFKKHIFLGFALTALALVGMRFFGVNKTPPAKPLSKEELLALVQNLYLPPVEEVSKENGKLVLLGQRLFFDPVFSQNEKISCATCHDPQKDFTDGKPVAEGVFKTSTNSPTILNARLLKWFFFNGRADSLEMQALGPIENPKEHGFSRGKVVKELSQKYKKEFEEIFGAMPSFNSDFDLPGYSAGVKVDDAVSAFALSTLGDKNFLKFVLKEAQKKRTQPIYVLSALTGTPAGEKSSFDILPVEQQDQINLWFTRFGIVVAAFERTIQTKNSPFDQFSEKFLKSQDIESSFVSGFKNEELKGLEIFLGKGACFQCHHGPLLSDQQFHNVGFESLTSDGVDLGRTLGLLLVKNDSLNCKSKFWTKSILESETCKETDFVDLAESDLVGAFKTPTLRNIKNTAPYGRDGRFATLKEILDFYNDPTSHKPAVGHRAEVLKPLNLSKEEIVELSAFLESLTGEVKWGP